MDDGSTIRLREPPFQSIGRARLARWLQAMRGMGGMCPGCGVRRTRVMKT